MGLFSLKNNSNMLKNTEEDWVLYIRGLNGNTYKHKDKPSLIKVVANGKISFFDSERLEITGESEDKEEIIAKVNELIEEIKFPYKKEAYKLDLNKRILITPNGKKIKIKKEKK